MRSKLRGGLFAAAVCLLAALICITIVSKCSPLYAFHDGNDVNWFLTMGRGMAQGKVPYKDLFEQKGVLLYMLFALNYLICGNSLYFIWIVEVLCGAAFLFAGYKTFRLFLGYRTSVCAVFPLALVTFTCRAFWCGGGEAEEYFLAAFAFGVYVFLRSGVRSKCVTLAEAAVCGALSGLIFWVKYSMLAFFLALAACVFIECCMQKKAGRGFACAGVFIAAFAAVSIPFLAYLAANDALGDMWRVYIGINLFGYAGGGSLLTNIVDLLGAFGEAFLNPVMYALAVCGAVWLCRKCKISVRMKVCYIVIMCFTFVVQCLVMGNIGYYHLVMTAFVPLGIVGARWGICGICAGICALFNGRRHRGEPIGRRFESAFKGARERMDGLWARGVKYSGGKVGVRVLAPAVAALAVFGLIFGNNTLDLLRGREDFPQFRAAELTEEAGGGSLLCYKIYDRGFYTARDEVPQFYYFALNLIDRGSYPDMYEGQEGYVTAGEADFVVTETACWEEERETLLSKYEYAADLSYTYNRSNLGGVRLSLCLLALKAEYGGAGAAALVKDKLTSNCHLCFSVSGGVVKLNYRSELFAFYLL